MDIEKIKKAFEGLKQLEGVTKVYLSVDASEMEVSFSWDPEEEAEEKKE